MNPFDFVPIDWNNAPQRRAPAQHHKFSGISGRIEGTITAETPIFIPESDGQSMKQREPYKFFLRDGNGKYIIPGSSLKGLVRSLVETIGPGCWWLFGGKHHNKLPHNFHKCTDKNNLCIACRMFGFMVGSDLIQGHVSFDDAICQQEILHSPMYSIILSSPKDRHSAFYLDENDKLAGRKYYYHHSTPPVDVGHWLPDKNSPPDKRQNQYIRPLDTGSRFTFSGNFNNLSEDEFALLLYALNLEPDMRHKIGYAKPAGFGSVKIVLTRLDLIDYQQRYTSSNAGETVYTEEMLTDFILAKIAPYVKNKDSVTLNGLRKIWAWPGRNDIQYPNYKWFKNNPTAPLSETP